MSQNNLGSMKCLAFVSAGIKNMIDSVKDSNMIVIDGCPLDCTRLCLEKAGFTDIKHLRVTDLGFEKGKTGISDAAVEAVAQRTEELLAGKESV